MGILRKGLAVTLSSILLGTSIGAVPVVAQEGRLTCESVLNGYTYCQADTKDDVRLVRQISNTYCDKGSSWGYDRRGIWVDRGCRAEFEYGRSSKTEAIVAGSLIGGALLAAILVANKNKNKEQVNGGDNYEQPIEPAPNWLVGTFRGYEGTRYPDLTIYPDGRVWTGGSGKLSNSSGTYFNDTILIKGEKYNIDWQGDGFELKHGNKAAVYYSRLQ